jgi:ubiquinone/menaquinone biosynthesis C-methylase UbiE
MLIDANARRKVSFLVPYLIDARTVLDFGCGDLAMDKALLSTLPDLQITGVDVVDFGIRDNRIDFLHYDGKKLPFANNAFDVSVAWHVFHHTKNPEKAFTECLRVAKSRTIFVEPIWRYKLEIPGMMVMDWVFNIWKHRQISMEFAFHSESWWRGLSEKYRGNVTDIRDVELLPNFFPTGRSLLFVVEKH